MKKQTPGIRFPGVFSFQIGYRSDNICFVVARAPGKDHRRREYDHGNYQYYLFYTYLENRLCILRTFPYNDF